MRALFLMIVVIRVLFRSKHFYLVPWVCTLLLCGCGGGSDGQRQSNRAPVANAGKDIQVNREVLAKVELDGRQSQDPDGDALSYYWEIVSAPEGAVNIVNDDEKAQASFTAFESGSYLLRLTVKDSAGMTSQDLVWVDVNTIPSATLVPAPAVAQGYQSFNEGKYYLALGSALTLNGEQSHDLDDDILTYQWSISKQPEGSLVEATADGKGVWNFTPDMSGHYEVSLIVSDGLARSAPVTQAIVVEPGATRLDFRVDRANYAASLNKLVLAAKEGQTLTLLDPETRDVQTLELGKTILSLSLSSSGKRAAVGHDKQVSYLDLETPRVLKAVASGSEVSVLALADNGYVYTLDTSNSLTGLRSLNLDTGEETVAERPRHPRLPTVFLPYRGRDLVLSADQTALYGAEDISGGYSRTGTMDRYQLDSGKVTYAYDYPHKSEYVVCGKLWRIADRMFSRCGHVFGLSNDKGADMQHQTQLTDGELFAGVSVSETLGEIAAVQELPAHDFVTNDPRYAGVRLYDADTLSYTSTQETLPLIDNGVRYNTYAKHAFYLKGGKALVVVAEAINRFDQYQGDVYFVLERDK